MSDETYTTSFMIEHVTDKAILVKEAGNDIWLPLSMIEIEGELLTGELVVVTMPEWLALKKDLI